MVNSTKSKKHFKKKNSYKPSTYLSSTRQYHTDPPYQQGVYDLGYKVHDSGV